MIKKMTILMLLGLFIACSSNDEENMETFKINGEFSHTISGCENSSNLDFGGNCNEFINFVDETTVSFLIDGNDIVNIGNYEVIDDQIDIEATDGLNINISFKIQDENTLIRTKTNEIWTKAE